jgi:ubiquitin-conjugating enzyme E2 Q
VLIHNGDFSVLISLTPNPAENTGYIGTTRETTKLEKMIELTKFTDSGGYPGNNCYLVYTNDEVPIEVGKILDDAMTSTAGLPVAGMLRVLSRQLCGSLGSAERDEDNDSFMTDVEDDFGQSEDFGDSDVPFDFDYDDDFGLIDGAGSTVYTSVPADVLQRIRQDFRAVRTAGYRVGKICGLGEASEYSIVSTSVKASKLGLSDETRTAWNLESSAYVVLLIKYTGGYTSFDDVISRPAGQTNMEFRLRKCSKYRPTLSQAIAAFSPSCPRRQAREDLQKPEDVQDPLTADCKLSTFGVGGSIDLLLNKDFLVMAKTRKGK